MGLHRLILSPLQIDNIAIPNRIVMPPMVTFLAGDDGLVTQAHNEHYKHSAGPGLVIVEGTAVSPEGRMSNRQLGIYSDRHTEGFSRIAQAIHEGGSVAGIQIHHAGATAFAETRQQKYQHLPSILFRLLKQHFTVSGLHQIQEAFRQAARRAVEAGFDIIELHAAHGYIFTQFLSPFKNWRIDSYGGNIQNRRRFLIEVYSAVKEEIGDRALATCRLGIADGHVRGLSLSDGLATASALEKEGMKLLHVSSGSGTPSYVQPEGSPYTARLHLAREAKKVLTIPVIGGGGIRHPDHAERALQDGMADLIWVGHGMLADPAWARKTIEGKSETISLCRECKSCFHFTDALKCPARARK